MAQSSRRLFFTYCEQSLKERGHWHADIVFGSGSAVLLRYEQKFFLLTAKHVLTNNLHGHYQNESPFFTTVRSRSGWSNLTDLLYPARLWEIGPLVESASVYIDSNDVALVELFQPFSKNLPNHFIDLDGIGRKRILPHEGFFNGQILFASGYPHWTNPFHHESVGEFTHHTDINRLITPGVCRLERGEPSLSFEITEGNHDHDRLNGMSGGVVFNLRRKMNKLDWCGITLSGGNGILRFVPAYLLVPAILRYKSAACQVIDPAVALQVSPAPS